MGSVHPYTREKLVLGFLSPFRQLPDMLLERVCAVFGEIERISGPYPFSYTDYYGEEMGQELYKHLAAVLPLVEPDLLAELKTAAQTLEGEFLGEDGRRTVNIDPGLLSAGRFVLATTKDRGHRIPIGKGIYAEVTLLYVKGEYVPLPWTYADFSSDTYRGVLKEERRGYLRQLREFS